MGEALDTLMIISESHRQQRAGVEGERSSMEERSLHDTEEKVTSWLRDFGHIFLDIVDRLQLEVDATKSYAAKLLFRSPVWSFLKAASPYSQLQVTHK